MAFQLAIVVLLLTVNAANTEAIHNNKLNPSLVDITNQLGQQALRQDKHEPHIKRLLQALEGEQINKQNEQAFKTLRQGLDKWPKKPTHFGKSTQSEMLQRLNAVQRARQEALNDQIKKQIPPLLDNFEKQLLDKEDIRQQIKANQQAQRNKNKPTFPIQKMFYIVISILIVIYLFKCISKRCLKKTTRIRIHNQEAETLNII